MDKYGIGKLSGTEYGSVTVKGTVITEYQALSDCQRDITGHLNMLKMRGEDAPLFAIFLWGVIYKG